jgi:hypothetical protein
LRATAGPMNVWNGQTFEMEEISATTYHFYIYKCINLNTLDFNFSISNISTSRARGKKNLTARIHRLYLCLVGRVLLRGIPVKRLTEVPSHFTNEDKYVRTSMVCIAFDRVSNVFMSRVTCFSEHNILSWLDSIIGPREKYDTS